MDITKHVIGGIAALILIVAAILSITIIPEGHVGIIKQYGKADRQIDPGLNFRIPLIESVTKIGVRQRKNTEELEAATFNQLAIMATVSINWTVNKNSAMELFVEYGGLDRFESEFLDPKLRSAAKAAISKYTAEQLIRNRITAVDAIMKTVSLTLKGYPITINSPQIENIKLPDPYQEAIVAKEKAKEEAEREKHLLEQQRQKSLQLVNTAKANAESKQIEADAEAYRIRTVADAESDAVRIVAESLRVNELYADYVRAVRWNGILPSTLVSESAGMLIQTPAVSEQP